MPDQAPRPLEPDAETARITRVYHDYRVANRGRLYDPSNPGNRAIYDERARRARQSLERAGLGDLSERRVLDVGCGSGHQLAQLRDLGATSSNMFGIDLLPERIEDAVRSYPDIDFSVANAIALNFPEASFDLLLSFTVFSSILDADTATKVAAEMTRVLKPGGAVLWYDLRFDNPSNPHVHGLTQKEIRALFPGLRTQLKAVTLLPPIARRLGALTPAVYPLLASLPFLRTHLLGLLIKPGPADS